MSTSSAGTSVRAVATATTTTATPAAPIARRICGWNTSRPAIEIATVSAENVDRAPRGRHRALDGRDHRPVAASATSGASAVVVDEPVQLLAEPRHDEQAVVDRQAQPEDGHDVDDRRVEVHHVREAEQRRQAARDRRERAGHGHGGGQEPAEDEHHDEQGDRQRDGLAGAQVGLDLVGDRVDDQRGAADDAGDVGGDGLEVGRDVAEAFARRRRAPPLVRRVGQVGCELDDDEEAVAVLRDERGRRRVRDAVGQRERVDDRGDPVDRDEVGASGVERVGHVGVAGSTSSTGRA